jgi:hypothetical protein
MCPHTAICVSAYCYVCVLILLYMSSYCYICVLILLRMCPHTATYVSSYFHTCVLILLYMRPHTTIHKSPLRRGRRGLKWRKWHHKHRTRVPPLALLCQCCVRAYWSTLKRVLFFFPHKKTVRATPPSCARAAASVLRQSRCDCCVRAHATHALKEAVRQCCISAYLSARALSSLRPHTLVA